MDPIQNSAQNPLPTSSDPMTDLPEVMAIKSQIAAVQQPLTQTEPTLVPAVVGSVEAASARASLAATNAQAVTPIIETNTRVPGASLHPDSPVVADDNDLIEQEWVEKAKAIVERTHDNPYQQNQEISLFKADYINKRYKREIKVNEA